MALALALMLLSSACVAMSVWLGLAGGAQLWASLLIFSLCTIHLARALALWKSIQSKGWQVSLSAFIFRYEMLPTRDANAIPERLDCESLPSFEPMHDDLANLCDVLETVHGAACDHVEVYRSPRIDDARLAKFILQSSGCRPATLDKRIVDQGFAVRVPAENVARARSVLSERMPALQVPET